MKNLLKTTLLAAALFTSTSFMSKDKNFIVSFKETISKTINFELSKEQNITLFVYDDNENEIYSDKIGTINFISKSYNFEILSEGTYYLVAESDEKIEKYQIIISGEEILVEETPVSVINKPLYTIEDNLVTMRMNDLDSNCKISVIDFSNNVYYEENKSPVNGEIKITFKLDPDTSKNYIITIEKNGSSYNKVISL